MFFATHDLIDYMYLMANRLKSSDAFPYYSTVFVVRYTVTCWINPNQEIIT